MAGRGALKLTLDTVTLAYTVHVDGQGWFDSASSADGGYAFSSNGTKASLGSRELVPTGPPSRSSGSDQSGSFESVSVSFSRAGSSSTTPAWVATFKAYTDRPALVFGQRWMQPVLDATGGSTFPSLHHVGPNQLGTLEYTGASCGFMVSGRPEFPGITGGSDKGYIVISPRDAVGTGVPASLALGPVTEHFVNQARNENSSLIYGMAPTFKTVPAGFELETVLVGSVRGYVPEETAAGPMASIPTGGVNAALAAFGDFLLARHNKTRALGNIKTETEYIGYSTTAFYFYNLCDCLDVPAATTKSAGKPDPHNRQTCEHSPIPAHFLAEAATPGVCASYADTLIAVNAALKAQGIPIRHFLLDSWWYGEGWNGGVSLWEDVPACTGNDTSRAPAANPADSFPRGGLKAFRETVGLDKTIWVHNGAWTADSPYRSEYLFASGEPKGPPQGPELWNRLFAANKQWGLSTIKQDHIKQQVGYTKSAYTNITLLKSWMSGMGEGATNNGVGVLYCCAEPNIRACVQLEGPALASLDTLAITRCGAGACCRHERRHCTERVRGAL